MHECILLLCNSLYVLNVRTHLNLPRECQQPLIIIKSVINDYKIINLPLLINCNC